MDKFKNWQKRTGWSNGNLFFAILLLLTVIIGGGLDLYVFLKHKELTDKLIP